MTYQQRLRQAMNQCAEHGEYPQNAQLLILEICRNQGIDLYREFDQEVKPEINDLINEAMGKLLNHMPVAYILGYDYFYGYKLIITKDVLIPRSETEELVMNTLQAIDDFFPELASIDVVDIGTGSGAIAIALALEEPKLKLTATDISQEALTIAKINANALKANIEFIQSDMLNSLLDNRKFDVLISNPPYIKNNEKLESSVVDYEPTIALFGGEDGTYFYQQILANAKQIINKKALLTFEIGYDQKEQLLLMAKHYFPTARIEIKKDINHKDRVLMIWVE
jgi:release factor glutamine methyltransferase